MGRGGTGKAKMSTKVWQWLHCAQLTVGNVAALLVVDMSCDLPLS